MEPRLPPNDIEAEEVMEPTEGVRIPIGNIVLKIQRVGETGIRFLWEGDTSKWTAKEELRAIKLALAYVEAVDKGIHGKKTMNWHIVEFKKDD